MSGTNKPERPESIADTDDLAADAETEFGLAPPEHDIDGDAPTVPGIPLDALRIDPNVPTQRIRPADPDAEDEDEAEARPVDSEADTIPPSAPLYPPPHHGERALPTDPTVHARPRNPVDDDREPNED